MTPVTITVFCVETEHGETIARYLAETEARTFATDQQRLRGRTPVDRLHVVPREFVPKPTAAAASCCRVGLTHNPLNWNSYDES